MLLPTVNVILVFTPDCSKLLMCLRRKNPYKGLYNLVGGKLEDGEDSLDGAYRELWEETGITQEDIRLCHMFDTDYHLEGVRLEVYGGRLTREIAVHGDENGLVWMDAGENFFDTSRFAGEGNIGHMVHLAQMYREQVLGSGAAV